MKKHACIILLAISLSFAAACSAFSKDDILCNSWKDAEKHMKAESNQSKTNAFICLNTLIAREPLNSENQLKKGEYCLQENDYGCAYEMFRISMVVENYKQEVVSAYITKSNSLLLSDKNKALELYRKAVELDRSQGKIIAGKLMAAGMENEAITFDNELRQQIYAHNYSIYQSMTGENALPYLEKANRISGGKYNKELAEKKKEFGYQHLKLAKQLFVIPDKQTEAESRRKKAVSYLGEETVDKEMPLIIAYHDGDQPTFQIAKGNYNDYWIGVSSGTSMELEFQSVRGSKYKICLRNGSIFDAKDLPKKMQEDFRILAIEDSDIKLVFGDISLSAK